MYRKWKSVAALGMAVLIGCSMPMGTMLAAEENPEAVQEVEVDSASDTDVTYDDETVLDDKGNDGDEIDADDENAVDEVDADDEIADEEGIADNDGNAGIAVMSAADAEAGDVAVQEDTAAPVISITLNGENCTYSLGDELNYKYIKDDPKLEFELSVANGNMVEYSIVKNPGNIAMGVEDLKDVAWNSNSGTVTEQLSISSEDFTCVVYVKATADGKTVYARSCVVVVDTKAPTVTGVVDGGTYPEGTTFKVEDDNFESVTVNGQPVTPAADGSYQVTAAGTTCGIIAKDKAGNKTECSITVTAREPEENGVIPVNGTYSLTAGTPYQLAEGTWQVNSDKSVYAGGNTFYVKADGNYRFTKR